MIFIRSSEILQKSGMKFAMTITCILPNSTIFMGLYLVLSITLSFNASITS
uniref:C2 protein n=1 Tax=Banana bunchy top virus TaxID=12585 RepID=Q83029_BBTV|nr:C2 [Banana bunchy top virus]prf//2122372D ORF C2 [Banana bunchy top virus]